MNQLELAYKIAKTEIGVKEIYGNYHNARILEYHSTCFLHATSDEVPWCSAFVNWCFLMSGLMIDYEVMSEFLNNKKIYEKSVKLLNEKLGEHKDESIIPMLPTQNAMARSWLTFGNSTKTPHEGDLVIFSRGNDNISGHVGFFFARNELYTKCLGGNQKDVVNISTYSNDTILGYRTLRWDE